MNKHEITVIPILNRAFKTALKYNPDGGTILEFGVCRGITYTWMAQQIKNHGLNCSLIGFDSWAGLPQEDPKVWHPKRHNPGNFAAAKHEMLAIANRNNIFIDEKQFKLVDGFFEQSLTKELQSNIKNLIFVNIDVDLYISTKQLLEFITPLIQVNTVLYFDDWKDPKDQYNGKWGEHLAFEEWQKENSNFKFSVLEINKYNQNYMICTDI